jgi:NitT/TauT family transport system substrate-binding protein
MRRSPHGSGAARWRSPASWLALGLVLLLAATPIASARAQAVDKIKIALHWNAPIAGFVHYYAAISKGFYKEENLELELLGLGGSGTAIASVSAGDAQFAQAGAESVISGFVKRQPVRAIFLLYQLNPSGLIVEKKSGIRAFADLKGRSVATAVSGSEGRLIQAKIRDAGLDPDRDVRLLNVAPAAKLTMLLTGQAEGATGFVNFQLIQAQAQGRDVLFLPFSTPERPLYGHAIVANTRWLDANADKARRFLRATIKGLIWSRDNLDQAVDLVVKWDPSLKIDRDFVKRDWEIELTDLIAGGLAATRGLGHMELSGWVNMAKLTEERDPTGSMDFSQIFTNAYIPENVPKW